MSLRPREYGQPNPRGFEAAMDGLTDVIAFSRSQQGRAWEDRYIHNARAWAQTEGEDPESVDEFRRFFQGINVRLTRAEPFYVSEDVCELLLAAQQSLPKTRLDESDLLTPDGFAWFSTPIEGLWKDPIGALAWSTTGPYRPDTDRNVGVLAAYVTEGSRLIPGQVVPLPFGSIPEDRNTDLFRLSIAFWLLSAQRILLSHKERVSRAVRRRAQREIETVVLVNLRRPERPATDGTSKVDWTHRWLVRGFWRNQWYPGEGRHKPLWIADYVKGPSEKPFVAKRRAFELMR